MMFRVNILFVVSFLVCAAGLSALNLWRHPEVAERNTIFVDVGLAPLIFDGLDFPIFPLEMRLDYLPPLPLPFSIGGFFKTPNPNLRSFGGRLGYHLDLQDSKTDLYFAYIFDCGFIRNDLLEEYNDVPVEIHYYDFRIGVRRLFGPFLGLAIESDFKAGGLIIALCAKIH